MIDYIRLQPCICTICGEYLNVVLHIHAEKHGYNSAEEFINSGKVIFKNEDFNRKFKESLKDNKLCNS